MIVAEIIVAITFVGKVVIDTHAKNLEDQIKLRDFELQQFAVTVEPILRKLQNKGTMYTNLWNGATQYADIVAEIHSLLPNPGAEVLITLNGDEVSISGEESFSALASIESAMKASNKFVEVSVTQLNTDTASEQGISGNYLLSARIAVPNNRENIGAL